MLEGAFAVAGLDKFLQFLPERFQGGDSPLDHRDLARGALADRGTTGGLFVAQSEQISDLLQGETEPFGPLKEEHSLDARFGVTTVATRGPPWLVEEALPLVKPDGFDADSAPPGKLADCQR